MTASTPPAIVPPIFAENDAPRRAPAIVVGYLTTCAVLTVLGVLALVVLKLQNRW